MIAGVIMPEHNEEKCAIWPEFTASASGWQYTGVPGVYVRLYESPRAGGRYHIDSTAHHELQQPDISDLRKKVSWWLASQRRQGVKIPQVTRDVLPYLQTQPMLHPGERAEWLLWYLADRTTRIGERLSFLEDSGLYYGALVATQSVSMSEILEFTRHLIQSHALESVYGNIKHGTITFSVTVAGFEEVRQRTQAPAYDQAFVAMWFAQNIRHIYDKGIKPAIEGAGYKPYLIIGDPSVDKIDDAIIANIRQSKFVVADLTHGDDGHRGSVYYETGFAQGLGLEVIRTCRSDLIDANSLAFDTRQHNHIRWDKDNTNYPAFIQELTDRIIARVGRGPIQDNALRGQANRG